MTMASAHPKTVACLELSGMGANLGCGADNCGDLALFFQQFAYGAKGCKATILETQRKGDYGGGDDIGGCHLGVPLVSERRTFESA
jgi:hypothetical protein